MRILIQWATVIMLTAAISLSSCATLLAPRTKTWQLRSEESHPKFYLDGRRVGKKKRPGVVRARADVRYAYEVSGQKKGCEETTVTLDRGLSG